MKAQALHTNNSMMHGARKILEINTEHPLILDVKNRIEKSTNEKALKRILDMLFSTALIDSGFSLEEPSKYAQQIYKIMSVGLDDDDESEEDKEDKEDKEVEAEEVVELETVD
jgi:molecular chaperone HtpG